MQKTLLIATLLFVAVSFQARSQQRLQRGGMTYFIAPKPNVIIYHDSIFNGAKQFRSLFYRYHDYDLIRYMEKHQSNKVTGQVLGIVGTVATLVGIGQVSSDRKGLGWALIGGGFASTITSGYLLLMGQRNLATAVTLFNSRYHNASLGIGLSGTGAGIVYKL